jgi:hypothetical protein
MELKKPTLDKVADVNDTSFKEVLESIKSTFKYLKSKWLSILLLAIVGGMLGFAYTKFSKTYYVAECTFVLDEESGSKSNGLSALGLGINPKGGDFFTATDNIIWLYSTRLMLQKTLLTTVDSLGKKKLLINWFIEESELGKKEFSKNPSLRSAKFDINSKDSTLTRAQNAIISRCAGLIKTSYLKVVLVPKTENVIGVSFKSKNELFAQEFTKELVANVNGYYIQTKTKKAAAEVALLESKAGQYKSEMSSNMYQVASGFDNAPYANPNRLVLKVEPQRKQVDAKISGEIYGELVQQLELSRTNLQKQMPLIQIIEEPILPLNVSAPDLKISIIAGIILLGFIAIIFFVVKFQMKKMIL